MKTTKFFSEIKKVAKDSTITSMFAYSVNQDKNFYEIILRSEPTKKVQDMCAKNGFSITKNIMNVNEDGEMVAHTVWEVRPINAEDIEYVPNDEVLCNINGEVIIASDQAMIDAGLFKCNPRKGEITLWIYNAWGGSGEPMSWAPIMSVYEKPLTEDITDEKDNVIEPKSTHKIAGFYGALVGRNFDLRYMLTKRGVTFKAI